MPFPFIFTLLFAVHKMHRTDYDDYSYFIFLKGI